MKFPRINVDFLALAVIVAFFAVLCMIDGCGGVRTVVKAVTPPLPPSQPVSTAPVATPATVDAANALLAERDALKDRLASVQTRLDSFDQEEAKHAAALRAEARQHQLDIIATWLTWLGVLAVVGGIVLAVFGLRSIGGTVGACGIGVLSFARSLAEYGHLLKYVGAVGAIGIVAWIAWSHRKTATKAAVNGAVADATITAIEKMKRYADMVDGPEARSALLSSLTSQWSEFIDARRVDLGLKKDAP